MVLTVAGANDDGSVDAVIAKTEFAQEVEGQELETVAVVPVPLQGLLQGRPVIDGAVGDVVIDRPLLNPERHSVRGGLGRAGGRPRQQLAAELGIATPECPSGRLTCRRSRSRHRRRFRLLQRLGQVRLFASLPSCDFRAPHVPGRGWNEVSVFRRYGGVEGGTGATEQARHHGEQGPGRDRAPKLLPCVGV